MNRLVAFIIALLFAAPALAQQTPELTFGADAKSNAPYAFADPADQSKLIGFEKEIIDAVAKRMGRTARLVQNDWDALIPGLNRGLYDVVMNGLEITPEHEEVVNFSIPYYTTFEQLAVRTDDPYHNLADLHGRKVGTLKASLAERILQAAGNVVVVTYDEEVAAYSDLRTDGPMACCSITRSRSTTRCPTPRCVSSAIPSAASATASRCARATPNSCGR
jgi:polar amino acid transport system substrate-binding protein